MSPIKEPRKPLQMACKKTKQQSVAKIITCIFANCEAMYPGEGDFLQDMVFEAVRSKCQPNPEPTCNLDETCLILKDIYVQAESWTFKRQILSILAKTKNFSEVKQVIFILLR